MRWPKHWSFSFSIIRSKEHPGLISFRMGWLDLLAVQGTLKSLLQHHISKASVLRCSAFFTVQLSHPYGKTIALTRQTLVGKVMSLLLNQWRNNSRKNEGMEPKQKQYPAVDVTGNRSKIQCCKEQYCIGTWNVRYMNQGKLEVVKQEMARVNIDILGISELT